MSALCIGLTTAGRTTHTGGTYHDAESTKKKKKKKPVVVEPSLPLVIPFAPASNLANVKSHHVVAALLR